MLLLRDEMLVCRCGCGVVGRFVVVAFFVEAVVSIDWRSPCNTSTRFDSWLFLNKKVNCFSGTCKYTLIQGANNNDMKKT